MGFLPWKLSEPAAALGHEKDALTVLPFMMTVSVCLLSFWLITHGLFIMTGLTVCCQEQKWQFNLAKRRSSWKMIRESCISKKLMSPSQCPCALRWKSERDICCTEVGIPRGSLHHPFVVSSKNISWGNDFFLSSLLPLSRSVILSGCSVLFRALELPHSSAALKQRGLYLKLKVTTDGITCETLWLWIKN